VSDADRSSGGDETEPESDRDRRVDRLDRHPTTGPANSLRHWREATSIPRVVYTYLFVLVARLAPSLPVKNWALRRAGVTVGEGVSWGLEATPDVFWPELITLEDHCIVGYDAVLLCHEFLQDEYRTGEIIVGERAMIGAKAVVLPGVHVGAGAQVAAGSLVANDVPPGETWAGVPARPVERGDSGPTDDDAGSGPADREPGSEQTGPSTWDEDRENTD
jgi:acetyltransferase-like isoleucine patch superfamily enzyme